MADRPKNRGLIYLRRSTNRQEASLEIQLQWAITEAARHAVELDATSADLESMRKSGLNSFRDIRLDDGITGADLKRPGFVALRRDALADRAISHLFIYRRDRLARPEDASEMVSLEKGLLTAGLTIVFRDGVSLPMTRGQVELGPEMAMYFGYIESGEFLRKLAERVISAQRLLAEQGYRTGGNAPYGFGRVLVDASGQILQELPQGRTARQPGAHVRIVARDEQKLGIWLLILELKESGWGYKRIAQHLNGLGIPSPGAGSIRTDHGVAHLVSGKWCVNTIKELCANCAILGLQDYGRRSGGAHRRLGEEGPRLLSDADRIDEARTRVVMNDAAVRISAPTGEGARFDKARWDEIHRRTEERGRSQRGIPRAQDPSRYPLSCRLVDLTDGCGSILYGLTNGGRALYKCGRYMRTEGAECQSNSVDAEALLRFTLRTIRQLVDRHGNRDRLRAMLEERARQERLEAPSAVVTDVAILMTSLAERKRQQEVASRRMATENDDARYQAIARAFDVIGNEIRSLEATLDSARHRPSSTLAITDEVDAALSLLDNVERITSDDGARADVNPLMETLGLRIGLTFGSAIKGKTRVVRRLRGGVMAFGGRPLSVRLHGPDNVESLETATSSGGGECFPADAEALYNKSAEGGEAAPCGRDQRGSCGCQVGEQAIEQRDCVPLPVASDHKSLTQNAFRRREGNSITKVNRGERI